MMFVFLKNWVIYHFVVDVCREVYESLSVRGVPLHEKRWKSKFWPGLSS